MAESGIDKIGVNLVDATFEANVIPSQVSIWSLGCDIEINDVDATIQDVKVNDIILSGNIATDSLEVDITATKTNVMDIDVNVALGGIHSTVVESQVVSYDKIKDITEISPEAVNEPRYAASARSVKVTYDSLTDLYAKIKVLEAKVENGNSGGGGGFPQDMWYYGDDGRIYTTKDVVVLGNLGVGGPGLGGNGEGSQVVTALSELTDVSIYNPKDGEILVYEGGKWINKVFSVDIPVMPDLEGYATEAWVERQGYVKATDIADPLSKIETFSDWFEWADEEHTTIRTKYNFFSQKQIAVGEKGEADSPASGGGITGIQVNGNIYSDADEFGIITLPNYPTELRWESVTGRPTKLTDFENDLDLSAYAGRQYVDDTFYTKAAAIVLSQGLTASQEAIDKLNVLLEWFKYDSVNDAVYTDKSFYSKLQLAAGERGENASAGGGTITGIRVNGKDYASPDEYGILTIPDYPTSLNWDEIIGRPTDLGQFTNEAGYITSSALEGYATKAWVEAKQYALASNVYDKDAINQKEKGLSDRIAPFEKWFREDSAGNLYTTYNFYSTKQLATGEAGAAHEGEGGGGRVNGIIINGTEYAEVDDYGNLIVDETFATMGNLAPYLKTADADSKYATKNYADSTFATITSVNGVDARLKEIEEYFNGSGEDADNKINKWNEIVAFLNATEDTTLAGILAAYTLKTDHNALAERVTANEGAISGINTTLGSHSSTLSEHTTAITTLGNKVNPIDTWFNEVGKYFKKDSDGVWYVDGDFYTKGQNAAGGVGLADGGSSGSGVMLLESWSDVPSSLSGYALSAALGIELHEKFNDYYTIGALDARFASYNSRLSDVDSSLADRYTKAESDGRYLKLSGGTISGLLTLEPQNYHVIDIVSPDPNLAQITMSTNDILRGILQYNTNYGFGFHHRGLGGIYVNLGGEPNFVDSANNKHTLIHTGNANKADVPWTASNILFPTGTSATWNIHSTNAYKGITVLNAVQAKPEGAPDHYAVGLSVSGYYGFTLASLGGGDVLLYRRKEDLDWKTIAFTDTNVNSAQALKNSNGTVGATAESSGLVSFASHIVPNNDSQAYVGVANKAWYAVYTNGLWSPSGKTLYLGANNSNHIIVNTSGNVTIGGSDYAGTSSKLTVDGGVTVKSYKDSVTKVSDLGDVGLVVSANTSRANWGMALWSDGAGKGFIQQQAFAASATTYALCLNPFGGNVGIGTTDPKSKLHVSGDLRIYGDVFFFDSSRNNRITFTHESDIARIYNNGNSTSMYIGEYSGKALNIVANNIGIGTKTPAYKLDVTGAGRFTDLLTASAGISTPHITIGGITISVVDGVLRIDGNVYTTGQLGVGAVGQEGGGTGGGGVLLLNTWPTDGGSYAGYALGGNLGIDLNTRVKTLEGKATAVSFSQTLTSGKQIGVLTIDGSSEVLYAPSSYSWSEITSRPSKLSDFTDDVVSGKYLPLTGGTISGNITIGKSDNTGWKAINFVRSGITGFIGNSVTKMEMGMSDGYIQVGKDVLNFVNNSTVNTIIHSDNVGNYAVKTYGTDMPSDIVNYVGYGKIETGWKYYGPAATFGISSYFFQLQKEYNTTNLVLRSYENGAYSDWKTIAFTDSNVASATKLETSRTIWGQSFDGTGDVSGAFTTSEDFIIDTTKYSDVYWARGINWRQNGHELGNLCYTAVSDRRISIVHGAYNSSVGLHIISNGNVLIGPTIDSGYKLDVAGSIRTTSSLTIGTIVLTDENGTLKIAGNAYTTGQLGAGEAGQPTSGDGSVVLDYDSIVDALGFTPAKQNDLSSLTSRVLALESAGPSSSSSSLYGDEITIGSSMGNIYISSENDVQIDSIMGSVLVNGSDVLTKANTSFTRNYTSGTKIGTIKIGGTSTDIYAPASSSSSLWITEHEWENDIDIIVSAKEYIGTNSIVGWDLASTSMSDLHIGMDGYTIYMYGSVDESSDMRLKTVIDAVNLDIRDIAFAPIFNYVFKSRPQGRQMLGSSAQYWQPITPSAVSENDKGNLAMNYGAIALASVVAVAKKTLTHEEEIANLKLKVQSLENRLARYELN